MIVGIFGCPSLTKLTWTMLFDALGAPFLYVGESVKPTVIKPTHRTTHLTVRMVLCHDAITFYRIQDRLVTQDHRYCVFITGNPTLLEEGQFPLWPNQDVSKDDLDVFDKLTTAAPLFLPLMDVKASIRAKYVTDTSMVQRCHTLFYRIPDKATRLKTQRTVWGYLSGSLAKAPVTGIRGLDLLLNDERARTLRRHAIRAKEVGVDIVVQEGADEFELLYLMHKVKKDEEQSA